MPQSSKRLFIAINLPWGMRQELATVAKFAHHPLIRWVPPENLHITLHFIGKAHLDEIDSIKNKISIIASESASFIMTIDTIKVIKKNRSPAMIWAAMEENKAFTGLVLQLQDDLAGDNSKKPNPHITLARIKQGRELDIPVLPEITKIPLDVRNIELMESVTHQSGPVYKVVETFSLRS